MERRDDVNCNRGVIDLLFHLSTPEMNSAGTTSMAIELLRWHDRPSSKPMQPDRLGPPGGSDSSHSSSVPPA